MTNDPSQDIRDRTFHFGCAVASVALSLAPHPGIRCLVDQLLRAATSIGANLEEAKAGSSKREFLRYVQIALREARESVYWIRVCLVLKVGPADELEHLRKEGDQIARILGAIVVSTKRRILAGYATLALCILNFASAASS